MELPVSKRIKLEQDFLSIVKDEKQVEERTPIYKLRFLARLNDRLFTIPVTMSNYICHEDSATVLFTTKGQKLLVTHSLEQLETSLNPNFFFRINRKLIINIDAIQSMYIISKSRIRLTLNDGHVAMVSRSKNIAFKSWLDI